MYDFSEITKTDAEVAAAMTDEITRQNQNLELIASENIASKAVMAAMGSPLTNKYAEGYPGKRYYGGCQYVDVAGVAGLMIISLAAVAVIVRRKKEDEE